MGDDYLKTSKEIILWYFNKNATLPSAIKHAQANEILYLVGLNHKRNNTVFKCNARKQSFLNTFKNVVIELFVDKLIIYSNKTYILNIDEFEFLIRKNTLKITNQKFKLKLKGEEMIKLHSLLLKKSEREESLVKKHTDNLDAKFICTLLLEILNDQKSIKKLGLDFKLNIKSKLDYLCALINNFTIHRIFLPIKISYNHEPLSEIQRLCEQFSYYKILIKTEKNIIFQIVEFYIRSYAHFRERIWKCYKAIYGESFMLKEKDFEIFVEKSDYETINLLFISDDFLFVMNNNDVEIRYDGFLVKYVYDINLMVKPKDINYNLLNTKATLYLYKTDEYIPKLKDRMILYHGSVSNSFISDYIKLKTNEWGNLLYRVNITFNNISFHGTITDNKKNNVSNIKGNLFKELIFVTEKEEIISLNFIKYPDYYNFTLFTMQLGCYSKRDEILAHEKGLLEEAKELYYLNINREKLKCQNNENHCNFFIKVDGEWIFNVEQ